MTTHTITIDLDKKCIRCGKKGAMENGICMKCLTRAIQKGEFDHIIKKHKGRG